MSVTPWTAFALGIYFRKVHRLRSLPLLNQPCLTGSYQPRLLSSKQHVTKAIWIDHALDVYSAQTSVGTKLLVLKSAVCVGRRWEHISYAGYGKASGKLHCAFRVISLTKSHADEYTRMNTAEVWNWPHSVHQSGCDTPSTINDILTGRLLVRGINNVGVHFRFGASC